MRVREMIASGRMNAEGESDDDEHAGEGVQTRMGRVPRRSAQEPGQENGRGGEEDESERGADGYVRASGGQLRSLRGKVEGEAYRER